MSDGIDPRLARRRRQVQEASARKRLRWLVSLLFLAISAGVVVAVFQSSWFSVDSISVEGAVRSPVLQLLEEAGVRDGVSIVSVRAGRAEEKLVEDPWVAAAEVRIVWPRAVEVTVVEHVPVARIAAGDTWLVSSGQGAVLTVGGDLVDPFVDVDVGGALPGETIDDPLVLGALEFIAALPVELKGDVVVTVEDQALQAAVAGHRVTLGRAIDMAQKAVTLAVLLDEGVADGVDISLLSPLRPAVSNPQPLVETSDEVATETTVSS